MGPLDKYILKEDTLEATENGFQLKFQSHWYRALPLSCMDFSLKINGKEIEKSQFKIKANGNEYSYEQLPELDKEWLFILDRGVLEVAQPLEKGIEYEIEFKYDLYIPYILVGPQATPLLASSVVKRPLTPREGTNTSIENLAKPTNVSIKSKTEIGNKKPSSGGLGAKTLPLGAEGAIKLATSLFSYAYEWNSGKYTLEDVIAETRKRNLGTGLEIIGFQSLRGFPYISNDTIKEVKHLLDKYEFEPVALDANIDVGIKRHAKMSIDETVAYIKPQILAAQKLGFPILRCQTTAPAEVYQKLVPFAEKANVVMGIELHTPYSTDHPSVIKMVEMFGQIQTHVLGFVPDMGTCMRAIPDALLTSFKAVGVTNEMIAITKEIWHKDIPTPAKFGELAQTLAPLGATPPQIGRLNMAFSMNGRQPVENWKEIMPYVVHLHGKFYGFDENGDEPSIDYPKIFKVFSEGGYKGYISSEYEGSAFTDEFDAFDMVEKQHMLFRKILNA
jgi:sugar phosphate isomerase/epimerase